MASGIPTLVIVGRPNVGKSTLFNRLAGRRIAVVQDMPGVTRDRLYAEFEHGNRRVRVVDTGGILFGDDDPLVEQIRVQAEVALAEADVVLFMVDADAGLHPADIELAEHLRRRKLKVLMVANKVDGPGRELQAAEFYQLGFGEVYNISALNGMGIDDVLNDAMSEIPKDRKIGAAEQELRLAIIGRPNVGKSSLLNAFTGESRAIVSDIPGTTRDAIDTGVVWKGKAVRLIDTAGIRRRGKIQGSIEYYMVLRASRALERAECSILVVDGEEGLTDGDQRVAHASHELGKPMVLCVNKWDLVEPPDGHLGKASPAKKDMTKYLRDHLPEMAYAPIRFTSAQKSSGLDGVINAAFKAVENWRFRIPTGKLNRLVHDAVFEKPLTRKGRALRVYYVTQPRTEPPTVILFVNDPELMHFSYQRYIANRIRAEFPMEGSPLRIIVRRSGERDQDG